MTTKNLNYSWWFKYWILSKIIKPCLSLKTFRHWPLHFEIEQILPQYYYRNGSQSWWRHQMEPFSALLAICAGNSPVTGESPAQRPVTRSFGVFFDLHLIKRLGKHSRGWWFETLSRPLWRHCNVLPDFILLAVINREWNYWMRVMQI